MTEYFKDHQKYGRRAIRFAKSQGWAIGVRYEDGELALKASTKHTEAALMDELYACSSGLLFFYNPADIDAGTGRPSRVGSAYFIHVNEPEESLVDYGWTPDYESAMNALASAVNPA